MAGISNNVHLRNLSRSRMSRVASPSACAPNAELEASLVCAHTRISPVQHTKNKQGVRGEGFQETDSGSPEEASLVCARTRISPTVQHNRNEQGSGEPE